MKYLKAFSMLLITVLLTGCISEDLDDCVRAQVYFSYHGDGTKQIFKQQINKLDLYVYDSQNKLVETRVIEQNELHNKQKTEFSLPSGEYNLIAIGNKFQNTEIRDANVGTRSQIQVAHPYYFDSSSNKEIPTNDSLYYGYHRLVIPDKYTMVYDTMPFASSHLKMEIDVFGLGESSANPGQPYARLAMDKLTAVTNFENQANKSQQRTYYPNTTYNKDNIHLRSKFYILRHDEDTEVTVDLKTPEGNYLTVRLDTFLRSHSDIIDLDNHEVLIPMEIKIEGLKVTVKVPDWYINEVDPGIK